MSNFFFRRDLDYLGTNFNRRDPKPQTVSCRLGLKQWLGAYSSGFERPSFCLMMAVVATACSTCGMACELVLCKALCSSAAFRGLWVRGLFGSTAT